MSRAPSIFREADLEGELETVADGSKVLTIELQSGDVLRIECEAVSFFEEPLS